MNSSVVMGPVSMELNSATKCMIALTTVMKLAALMVDMLGVISLLAWGVAENTVKKCLDARESSIPKKQTDSSS